MKDDHSYDRIAGICTILNGINYKYDLNNFDIIIHHGGAGIMSACCYYCIPQYIIATFVDQPMNIKIIQNYNIGTGCTAD